MRKPNPARDYPGLGLYGVLRRIAVDFPELGPGDIDISYVESNLPRFTVLSCAPGHPAGLRIRAATANPIRHLPANYQENSFLRGFLMVFQHIMNSITLKADNLSSFFLPAECPAEFLPELASWLGAREDLADGEERLRGFLRRALSLYRRRGTVRGLAERLALVCGVSPRILEGQSPYSALVIHAGGGADSRIFEAENAAGCFTVHFPVPREKFSEDVLRRISVIAQREKPAHMRCFISFEPPAKRRRKTVTINDRTRMDGEFFL
jgi:phage tail-like protein